MSVAIISLRVVIMIYTYGRVLQADRTENEYWVTLKKSTPAVANSRSAESETHPLLYGQAQNYA